MVSKENLLVNHPAVFIDGVRKINREYHIRLNPRIEPIQHAPQKVPVALKEQLKRTLDNLEEQDIITPVTKPMSWISSMVMVP